MPSSDTASLYSRPKKRRLSSETLPPADSPIKSHKRKRLYVELPSPKSTWRATTTSNNVGSSNTSPRTSSQGSTLMETEDDSVTVVDVEEEPIPENEILTAEMNMILDLLNAWCMEHDIDVDHVLDWLDSPRNCAENSVSAEFWDQVESYLPHWPLEAVFGHVVKTYGPPILGSTGADAILRSAFEGGLAWNDVDDDGLEQRISCGWSQKDKLEMGELVMKLTKGMALDPFCKIPWSEVAKQLGGCSVNDCITRWEALYPKLKSGGMKPRWGPLQSYYLVHHLRSLNLPRESDVDWRTIVAQTSSWNFWTHYKTAQKYRSLKKWIVGAEELSFPQVLRTLAKEFSAPPSPSVKSHRKKILRYEHKAQ